LDLGMYAVTRIIHILEDWNRKPPVFLFCKSILYKLKDEIARKMHKFVFRRDYNVHNFSTSYSD